MQFTHYDPIVAPDVRPAAVAGRWYPSDPDTLAREVDRYVADAVVEPIPPPRALIVPHAGLVYSGPVAAHAYRTIRNERYAAVVLVGPSHFVAFEGVSIWRGSAWQTPWGAVPVAGDMVDALARASSVVVDYPLAHRQEHSIEMQLPFVARLLPRVPIAPIVMGYQDRTTAFALGEAIAEAAGRMDGKVLCVASSDLSHYHEARVAAELDDVVLRQVELFDAEGLMRALEREPTHACGGGPMVAVMDAASRLGSAHARVLRYADSGDVSGDKSAVVGYMAAAMW